MERSVWQELMLEQAYLDNHQTVRKYIRSLRCMSAFESLRRGPSGVMATRRRPFLSGGSVAVGYDR